MHSSQKYQPTENQRLSSMQEVLYAKEFKQADIAAGFHKTKAQGKNTPT